MSVRLALADAAKNCRRDDALAVLTLKSGVQVTAVSIDVVAVGMDTVMVRPGGRSGRHKHETGGWAAVVIDEIAAVETRPYRGGL